MRIGPQFLLVLAAFFICNASASEPEIAKLSWLSGCWASTRAERGSGEHWTILAGETMLGTSRTVKNGKTLEFEFMELRYLSDGKLAFIAHPSDQRTTVFPVLRITDSDVVFENPQHDFPQRVAYARDGDLKLSARVEGCRNGELRVIEFPMSRVTCDTQANDVTE